MSDVARTQLGVTKLLIMNDLCNISVISDRGGGSWVVIPLSRFSLSRLSPSRFHGADIQ